MIRSGGVVYHLRALRFRRELWGQHQEGVASFLSAWNPKSKKILLIGPSAGYSLPAGWLNRFEEITAFEPDLLARVLFERRHGVRPRWIRRGFPFHSPEPFRGLELSNTAILFCNLLGQIRIPDVASLERKLRSKLDGREWASYHDALSGEGIEFDLEDKRPGRAGVAEMERWIYVSDRFRREVTVNAHPAPELFRDARGLEYRYWQWRIIPGFTHLIEGVFPANRPGSSGCPS